MNCLNYNKWKFSHDTCYKICNRSKHQRCSTKKLFLKISQNLQENTYAKVSFLIKLQAWACNFIKKETLAQVFSYEFCEISKNNRYRAKIFTCL